MIGAAAAGMLTNGTRIKRGRIKQGGIKQDRIRQDRIKFGQGRRNEKNLEAFTAPVKRGKRRRPNPASRNRKNIGQYARLQKLNAMGEG